MPTPLSSESMLFQRALTPAEMERIHQAVWTSAQPGVHACVTFYDIACPEAIGMTLDQLNASPDPDLTLNPAAFRIPDEQWKQVCEWCLQRGAAATDVGRVNHALDWMNTGPSAY